MAPKRRRVVGKPTRSTKLSSGGGGGGGAGGGAAAARARSPSLRDVALFGARPEIPAELFIVQGRGVYRVRREQIVSLRPTTDPTAAEQARGAHGRQPLIVNAGTPTDANPLAGKCFHDHRFVPTREETHEAQWWDASHSETPPGAPRWVDPARLERYVSPHCYCSAADVLARYAGGVALGPGGAALFQILFLNEGSATFAPRPEMGVDGGWRKWTAQRRVIANNLSKLLIVCPASALNPMLGSDGRPQLAGGGPVPATMPLILACLASIVSDKSPGAPGATHLASIGGYHDRCRLHLLPYAHVAKVHELVAHFELETHFPSLRLPGLLEHADAPLEPWRIKAVAELGPAQGPVPPPEWLRRRAALNCGVPWVVHCDLAHPDGAVDDEGRPELVPLLRDGAEERNGSPWLRLQEAEAATEHHVLVTSALARVAGRAPKVPPLPTSDAAEALGVLKAELVMAKKHIVQLRAECQRLSTRNRELGESLSATAATAATAAAGVASTDK